MKTSRQILFRIILALFPLLVLFLAGELALRIAYARDQAQGGDLQDRLEKSKQLTLAENTGELGLAGLVQASRFPDIVYELKPGLVGKFRNRTVSVNSAGFRGREYPLAKPPNTYRIAAVGDSVMFGWGVRDHETYLSVLEAELNALPQPRPDYEVLNFSVPGYNTAMEVATVEHKALAYDPDLILIHFVNNDWGIPKFMQKPREPFTFRRSYLWELIRTRLGWWEEQRETRLVGYKLSSVDDPEMRDAILSQYGFMVGPEGFTAAMSRLHDLAEARELPVILILGHIKGEQRDYVVAVAQAMEFQVLDMKPYTYEVLEAHGVPDQPKARDRILRVAPGDSHPSPFGHRIFAGAILRQLGEMGVVPAQTSLYPPPPVENP